MGGLLDAFTLNNIDYMDDNNDVRTKKGATNCPDTKENALHRKSVRHTRVETE